MARLLSTGVVLVFVVMAMAAAAADAHQQRGRMLLQQFTKEVKKTGSTPPSYKTESKTTGEWKVTEKKEFKDKGPATFKYEKKYAPKTVVSESKTETLGSEPAVFKSEKDKKGNKVTLINTGTRHFEYKSVSTHTVNLPQTEVVASGGTPATFIYDKRVDAPVKESKAVYASGAGPTFSSKWTATSSKGDSKDDGKGEGKGEGKEGGGEAKEGKAR